MPKQRRIRHEIGMVDGKNYKLVHDQFKNQQYIDHRYRNIWAWFLTVDGDYQGNFRLKREALEHIKTITVEVIYDIRT